MGNFLSVIFGTLFALWLCGGAASAQTCSPYPNNLTNGQPADATQVMANFNSVLNCVNNNTRPVLTSQRIYYVRTDGNDNNNGLSNSSAGAFATIQKAWNTVTTLDLNGRSDTIIQVGAGTYNSGSQPLLSVTTCSLGGFVTLQGDTTTPSNVVLNVSAGSTSAISVSNSCTLSVAGLKIVSSVGNPFFGLYALSGYINVIGTMDFGAFGSGYHIVAKSGGRINFAQGVSYTISGGAHFHWYATGGEVLAQELAVTINNAPAFAGAFAYAEVVGAVICNGNTFTGSATGPRYSAVANGVIATYTASPTYLPGSVAGSTATGGQYI